MQLCHERLGSIVFIEFQNETIAVVVNILGTE